MKGSSNTLYTNKDSIHNPTLLLKAYMGGGGCNLLESSSCTFTPLCAISVFKINFS